jgi:hypothetical protein
VAQANQRIEPICSPLTSSISASPSMYQHPIVADSLTRETDPTFFKFHRAISLAKIHSIDRKEVEMCPPDHLIPNQCKGLLSNPCTTPKGACCCLLTSQPVKYTGSSTSRSYAVACA